MRLRRLFRRRGRRSSRIYEPPAGTSLGLADGLAVVRRRWPSVRSPSDERPIFLLSAGWRSGSTLLQRVITASGAALVWGEPYGHAGLIDALAYPLRCFTDHWPHDDWFVSGRDPDVLGREWIANLYPSVDDLLYAQIGFFEAMFRRPAAVRGRRRWGLKETRLSSDHGHYLRWLFPQACLILLYRNPYDAYRSYRRWRSWYVRWPDQPLDTPTRFGTHWRSLVEGFVRDHERLDALLVSYEGLCAGKPAVGAIGRYLDLELPPLASVGRVGATAGVGSDPRAQPPPTAAEIDELRRAVEPWASRLGYGG